VREKALRVTGALAAAFFVSHAIRCMRTGHPQDLLWCCNVACALVAGAHLARSPKLNAVALMWLVIGNPCWVIDIMAGSELEPTTCLTHVGALVLAIVGAWALRMPSGVWWKAMAALVALQQLTRLVTPRAENINLAFDVYTTTKTTIPSYPAYYALLTVVFLASFFAVERAAIWLAGSPQNSAPGPK